MVLVWLIDCFIDWLIDWLIYRCLWTKTFFRKVKPLGRWAFRAPDPLLGSSFLLPACRAGACAKGVALDQSENSIARYEKIAGRNVLLTLLQQISANSAGHIFIAIWSNKTQWFKITVARTWQEHARSMAGAWQEHGIISENNARLHYVFRKLHESGALAEIALLKETMHLLFNVETKVMLLFQRWNKHMLVVISALKQQSVLFHGPRTRANHGLRVLIITCIIMYACMYVCMYIYIYMHMYTRISLSLSIYIYIRIYTHCIYIYNT